MFNPATNFFQREATKDTNLGGVAMAKTAVISARIDSELKYNTEQIFEQLGLTISQPITLFFQQVELQRGLPFALKIPNETTREALEDAQARRNLVSFNTLDELFEDLEI